MASWLMKEDLVQVAQVHIGDKLTIYYNLFNCNTVAIFYFYCRKYYYIDLLEKTFSDLKNVSSNLNNLQGWHHKLLFYLRSSVYFSYHPSAGPKFYSEINHIDIIILLVVKLVVMIVIYVWCVMPLFFLIYLFSLAIQRKSLSSEILGM